MLRTWPAVDVTSATDPDLALAAVDDFGPTALEYREHVRIFFGTRAGRDGACTALRAAGYRVTPVDVDDEDWARRSQEDLVPITVGCITVAPPWASQESLVASRQSATADQHFTVNSRPATVVVIQPSMGFGTGHHATTRLCLRALQTVDLKDRFLLDVGTGSGVLAIAAIRLGAARAVGIDDDTDAIQSAMENLTINPGLDAVTFEAADLFSSPLPPADVVTANLTGAFLMRAAGLLVDCVRPGGVLVISGLLFEERDEVLGAFAGGLPLVWEAAEEGWVALVMKRP